MMRRWDDTPVDYWPAQREDGYRSARGLGVGLVLAAVLGAAAVILVVLVATARLGETTGAWVGLAAFWVTVAAVLAFASRGGDGS